MWRQATGDAHVGFRTGDAPELARWAAKQRADYAAGALASERCDPLPSSHAFVSTRSGPCARQETLRWELTLILRAQSVDKVLQRLTLYL